MPKVGVSTRPWITDKILMRFWNQENHPARSAYPRGGPLLFQVQVAEFNETTSFRDQLAAVASAGVYVSVHTSNLANSPFLRPGAAVVEVIQRNWMYHGLDQSFQVLASALVLPSLTVLASHIRRGGPQLQLDVPWLGPTVPGDLSATSAPSALSAGFSHPAQLDVPWLAPIVSGALSANLELCNCVSHEVGM